jgi:hypothetical protein
LLLITIVAPLVLPPGLGLGKVERSPSPHAVIVNKHTASEYAAPALMACYRTRFRAYKVNRRAAADWPNDEYRHKGSR